VRLTKRTVEVSRTIEAPAPLLWELLTRTRYWPEWGPTVAAVEGPASIAAGTNGRLRTPVGLWLDFEITDFDEGRFWAWRVAKVGATTHRIQPEGEGRSTVTFAAPWFGAPYAGILWLGLRKLDELAQARSA
jgi:uncharacterized protein YndB with AHSA1/START domain